MICKRLSGPWIPPPAFGRPKVQSVGNFLPAILCPIFSPLPPKKAGSIISRNAAPVYKLHCQETHLCLNLFGY